MANALDRRHQADLKGGKMNFRILNAVTLIMLCVALLLPSASSAQEQRKEHHHYKLIDLGTLGGPQSYVNMPNSYAPVLNSRGTVAGWADTSTLDPFPDFCFNEENPCFLSHAFQWQNGTTH